MSPPHFRFYDEAPGGFLDKVSMTCLTHALCLTIERNTFCLILSFQFSVTTFTGARSPELKVLPSSRTKGTGWSGRRAAMTPDLSGVNLCSGGILYITNISSAFTKCIVFLSRDPAMKDYSLAANSPAWAIGFEEIDVAAIGPGGDVAST